MRCLALILAFAGALLLGNVRLATAHPVLKVTVPRAAYGDVVTIEWSGLALEVHEVELELSLDGGRWRRISPELEARDGGYAWRVPEWAAGAARIRLRVGGDGFERALGEPAVLSLAAQPARRASRGDATDGWWALSTEDRPSLPGITAPSLAATESSELADTDELSFADGADQRGPLCGDVSVRVSGKHSTPQRSRTPQRVPLRN